MHALTPTAAALRAAYAQPAPAEPDLLLGLKRLAPAEVLNLAIANVDALDRIARGDATVQELIDWVSNVLLWRRVAELLDLGLDEMQRQWDACQPLLERFARTGRVAFDGPGYQLAKHGVDVMDELARVVDQGTAHEAAVWTDKQLAALRKKNPNMERMAA
jgi:hypothetical protein